MPARQLCGSARARKRGIFRDADAAAACSGRGEFVGTHGGPESERADEPAAVVREYVLRGAQKGGIDGPILRHWTEVQRVLSRTGDGGQQVRLVADLTRCTLFGVYRGREVDEDADQASRFISRLLAW